MAVLPPDPVFILKSDMGCVHSVAFFDHEKDFSSTLLTATESGYVYLWDLESNRVKYKQKMGESIQMIHSVDKNIVTQEKSGTVKTWSLNESSYVAGETYDCYGGYCKSLIVDGFLMVPEDQGKVGVLDLDLRRVQTLKPREDNVGSVMCVERLKMKENDYVLVGYESGDVVLFDLKASRQVSGAKLKEFVTSATFDAVTRRGVCANSSNVLDLFAIDNEFNVELKAEISTTSKGCGIVKLRPDRKILVSGGWDGGIRVYSWKTLRLLVALTQHKKSISDVQFSPYPVNYWNSSVMAVGGTDGIVSLWNIYN